jgi:4-hydroxy 2-oxovalerate aldolase
MFKTIKVFDCTLREVGFQTGWFFDTSFSRNIYNFADQVGIDYIELGFFHDEAHDPGRGDFRYCSTRVKEINAIFEPVKKNTKISSMRDIQRPLSPLVPKKDTVIDAIRILTRSSESDEDTLSTHIEEIQNLGYEVYVNYTSSGNNTMERNLRFAEFVKSRGLDTIYFADTESIFTEEYVVNTIKVCKEVGLKVGMHLHDKNGTAELLADLSIYHGAESIDVTHMGLGGKWRDSNLPLDYLLRKTYKTGGTQTRDVKNELIEQIIKFKEHSCAI